jgi:hypothetical protein
MAVIEITRCSNRDGETILFCAKLLNHRRYRPLRGLGPSFLQLILGLAPQALCCRARRALFVSSFSGSPVVSRISFDLRNYRHARTKSLSQLGARVELYLYRNALNDLCVVPGGVVRR